ncbi:serine/threonine protein kinase [Saprolegnia parasitica CBS 223.65]|uniref:non-specific serine/threonine protein kinase n=1 Tax=Saprolegnia parasitica (strain CBS 223.65) TaxID=695850 RepID=A0A067CQH0_SAPPC|nr:serine/threonine protein kinase [Saprolegnia parasitica CBS 223.65]KDO32718.1 serine/threonine protein kinase [Saprolegnia parasitica CBS 223.65]|eukprot:XP_012196382.1 serine/threonine protein kinase [Saprolegnia parasitica CBS 223.65]
MWAPAFDAASGCTYYVHTRTGESVWDIPPGDEVSAPEPPGDACGHDAATSTWQFGGVDDDGQFFFVHTATGARVRHLPSDTNADEETTAVAGGDTSPSDTALPELASGVDPDVHACLVALLQGVETHLGPWLRRKQRNSKALQRSKQRRASPPKVRTLSTPSPNQQQHAPQSDEIEVEVAKIQARFVTRRARLVQKAIATERTRHMTRRLMHRATNGLDVHGKIHLQVPEVDAPKTLYESEERVALRTGATRALERVFVHMDPHQNGKLSALHILYCLATEPCLEAAVAQRRGLHLLVSSSDMQALLLNLGVVDVDMFVYFVDVAEEISEHIQHLKAAIEVAGLGIVAPELATWESSLSNVKTPETIEYPNRKLVLLNHLVRSFSHAMEALLGQLQPLLLLSQELPPNAPLWEYNHKHVYIQLSSSLPFYCCMCRRNRFRLGKLRQYQDEEAYRRSWGRLLADRMADIEQDLKVAMDQAPRAVATVRHRGDPHRLRFAQQQGAAVAASVVEDLVAAVELLHRDINAPSCPSRHDHIFIRDSKWLLHKLTRAREEVELQEYERSWLFEEDEAAHDLMENIKVSIEAPLAHIQESGHKEFLRLSHACTLPSIFLQRLHYDRLLAARPTTGQLVLRMFDSATSTYCVLYIASCTTSREAAFLVETAQCMQARLSETNLVAVHHAFSCVYQQFAAMNGNLNECWPVTFVALQDCILGEYLTSAPSPLPQADVLSIMTTVAAALTSLHSQGILHLNLTPSNLYRTRDDQLKVGGLLLFKTPYSESDVAAGMHRMAHLLAPAIVPPNDDAVSEKTDMWALGCLLYYLMTGSNHMCKLKPLSILMNEIPLRYGTSLRTCLRMLLQPTAKHRPSAADIFNFLSLASPDEAPSSIPSLAHKKKSTPELEPLRPV